MATLILKATEKCNSNCYYCDVVRKNKTGASMPLDTLQRVFERIDEFLKAKPEEDIEVLWHGGEPLLLGPVYFKKASELQKRHCHETSVRIRHNMQTNLTCFSEDYIDVLQELGINALGTSYDPEPNIRGAGSKIDSKGYNRKFMKSLEILENNNIGWGMIYVVTKKSLEKPLDFFFFLSNLCISGGFNMNPVLIYDKKRKGMAVTPSEYADFLGVIFPFWWKHRQRYPDTEPFRGFVDNIINGNTSLGCVDSGQCTYHHINISPDGEASQCGRSADWGLLQYGNIKEKSLTEILADSQRRQFDERNILLPKTECRGCRFWNICHGGCPLDAWSGYKSFMHKSEWCEAKRLFIEKYFEPVTGVRYAGKNSEN